MWTIRLTLEALVLFVLAVGITAHSAITLLRAITLESRTYGRRRQRQRIFFVFRLRRLLIWSVVRVVNFLMFAICVAVWLQHYREVQEQRSSHGIKRREEADDFEELLMIVAERQRELFL